MSTNFVGKTRLFPSDKTKSTGRGRGGRMPCSTPKSASWYRNFLPSVCLEGLFYRFVTPTVLHWTVLRCGALLALLSRYSRRPQTDATLRRCSVEWTFGKWKVQCMYICTRTVHAVVKLGEVQQHRYRRTYCTFTVVTLSLIHIWRCRRDVLCRSRWSPYH